MADFFLLTFLFISIGRGLALFDDYQNIPTASLMATGDIPPHFALDPHFSFNYHYLLLLFAAQFMRIDSMVPWTALDASRGLIIALPLVLAWLWTYRMTRNRVASVLTSIMLMFAGRGALAVTLIAAAYFAVDLQSNYFDWFCERDRARSPPRHAFELED